MVNFLGFNVPVPFLDDFLGSFARSRGQASSALSGRGSRFPDFSPSGLGVTLREENLNIPDIPDNEGNGGNFPDLPDQAKEKIAGAKGTASKEFDEIVQAAKPLQEKIMQLINDLKNGRNVSDADIDEVVKDAKKASKSIGKK